MSQREVQVTGVATLGNRVFLSLESGAVEVERGSHADLTKVKAGTRVQVSLPDAAESSLASGEVVQGEFVGLVVEQPAAAPRTSDGSNS